MSDHTFETTVRSTVSGAPVKARVYIDSLGYIVVSYTGPSGFMLDPTTDLGEFRRTLDSIEVEALQIWHEHKASHDH